MEKLQRIPDVGLTPLQFNDPEYSLEVVSRLTKMIRKIIVGMLDDQLVDLTDKNMEAFIFLQSIIKDCNVKQFEMYNTASEKDQLSILREVKHNCLYIAYDTDVPTHEVIYRLVKIVNDSTGDNDGRKVDQMDLLMIVKQVLTAPKFKHNRWFIDVVAVNDGVDYTTTIVCDTKVEVLQKYKLGNEIEVII